MKTLSATLAFVLAAGPVSAQSQAASIRSSIEKEAAAAAREQRSDGGRGGMFWSGLGLGVAGVTMAALGVTVARVEDSSTGNAPANAFQSCVAQKRDPIYASNDCNALKGKNLPLLWSGVAVGALGAVLLVGGTRTSAEVSAGAIVLRHSLRF